MALKLDGARSRALREDEAAPSYQAQAFHIVGQMSTAELKTSITVSDNTIEGEMRLQFLVHHLILQIIFEIA